MIGISWGGSSGSFQPLDFRRREFGTVPCERGEGDVSDGRMVNAEFDVVGARVYAKYISGLEVDDDITFFGGGHVG